MGKKLDIIGSIFPMDKTYIIPEKEVSADDFEPYKDSNIAYAEICDYPIDQLVPGTSYYVAFDGVDYVCTAYTVNSNEYAVCIGNGKIVGIENDNIEPFFIDSYPDGTIYLNVTQELVKDTTISLSKKVISKKCLPGIKWNDFEDKLFSKIDFKEINISFTTSDFSTYNGGASYLTKDNVPFNIDINNGYPTKDNLENFDGKYTLAITFDGVEYICKPKNTYVGWPAYYYGNDHLRDNSNIDTGEPFCWLIVPRGSITQVIIITTDTEPTEHRFVAKAIEQLNPENISSAIQRVGEKLYIFHPDINTKKVWSIEHFSGYEKLRINYGTPGYEPYVTTIDTSGNVYYKGTVEGTAMIVKSSTEGSTKRFKITVDDSGTISATEVT